MLQTSKKTHENILKIYLLHKPLCTVAMIVIFMTYFGRALGNYVDLHFQYILITLLNFNVRVNLYHTLSVMKCDIKKESKYVPGNGYIWSCYCGGSSGGNNTGGGGMIYIL
jgi:hypothetical protein